MRNEGAAREHPLATLASRTVLVVEDEWLVRMELTHAFEDEGCIVLESASADDALAKLRAHPEVTLLITDIRLTGALSGWDLAAQSRVIDPAIAVIYISANPLIPERAVPGGLFIDKPAIMAKVVAAAKTLLVVRD